MSSGSVMPSPRRSGVRLADYVPQLERIRVQIVELIHSIEVDVVDELPLFRAHALVAHF